MPSFKKTVGVALAGMTALSSALPSFPKLTSSQMKIHEYAKRQNQEAIDAGLTDIDILQFALTLEHLESEFYRLGFAQFPATDFQALGLTDREIEDLLAIGGTEEDHVVFLQSAIAQAGIQPVQACEYNFGFTDAAGMVATAAVLENVGVSAYAGAARLVTDKNILQTAATILSVEARHQSFVRAATKIVAVPSAFDIALTPRMVFSLAAPFFSSCPEGSNLAIPPFPTLAMAPGQDAAALVAGATVQLQSDAAAQATFCAFTAGPRIPGGTAFTPFDQATGCQIPQNLAGIVYVTLASAGPLSGVLEDDIVVAGPMVMQVS